jgi:hypothetical protein
VFIVPYFKDVCIVVDASSRVMCGTSEVWYLFETSGYRQSTSPQHRSDGVGLSRELTCYVGRHSSTSKCVCIGVEEMESMEQRR